MPARVEHVGSLLRPPYLRDARAALSRGEMAPAEFKAAEDRAVREAVALQDELNLPVVNDGEMRRESFQAELTAACDGFSGVGLDAWLWGAWHSDQVGDATIERPADLAVTAPLRKRRGQLLEPYVDGLHARYSSDALPGSPGGMLDTFEQRRCDTAAGYQQCSRAAREGRRVEFQIFQWATVLRRNRPRSTALECRAFSVVVSGSARVCQRKWVS